MIPNGCGRSITKFFAQAGFMREYLWLVGFLSHFFYSQMSILFREAAIGEPQAGSFFPHSFRAWIVLCDFSLWSNFACAFDAREGKLDLSQKLCRTKKCKPHQKMQIPSVFSFAELLCTSAFEFRTIFVLSIAVFLLVLVGALFLLGSAVVDSH